MKLILVFALCTITAIQLGSTSPVPNFMYIVGGHIGKEFRYKSLVALTSHNFKYPYCGGTILTPTIVLTAAHCIKYIYHFSREKLEKTKFATAGQYNVEVKSGNEQRVPVTKLVKHPMFYQDSSYGYDFALIHLKEPFQFNEVIKPAVLLEDDTGIDWKTTKCEAPGWGKTYDGSVPRDDWVEIPFMKSINVTVLSKETCLADGNWRNITTKYCSDSDGSSCTGDSGGPLYCHIDNQMKLVGVVSMGDPGCPAHQKTVWGRIPGVINWIKREAGLA